MPIQTFQDVLTISIEAGGALAAYDLVGFDGKKIDADDANVLGVAKSPASAAGEMVPIMVKGVVRLKAVGAIASAGAKLMSASAGGVKAATAPDMDATPPSLGADYPFAIALSTASDGAFVDIHIR